MFPPIDESVLKNNPGFANLYKSLSGDILQPDASTKNDSGAKRRDAVREELEFYRTKAAKQHLLSHALATAVPTSTPTPPQRGTLGTMRRAKSQLTRSAQQDTTAAGASQPQLPPELLDLLMLLPPFLDKAQTMPSSSLELLLSSPPFCDITTILPQLTPVLSSHLVTQASALARTLHPQTNPSFIHRSIPQILNTTQTLQSTLSTRRAALTTNRLATTAGLISHLQQHTEALVQLVRTLEAKHGVMANSATLRASEASLLAQHQAASLQVLLWETRGAIYPAEARVALQNYRRHLREAEMTVNNQIRTRRAELRDYGVAVDGARGDEAKETRMREMARVWREMEERLREVRGDLERLDRS